MANWQYRIIKHDDQEPAYFAIHEVYYTKGGHVEGWTEDPCRFGGDSKAEVLDALSLAYVDGKNKPTLILSKLERDHDRWYRCAWRWLVWQMVEATVKIEQITGLG